MKVLIIDHTGFQLNTRKALIEQDVADCAIDMVSALGEVYLAYKKGEYDLVILDHTIENGQACFDFIIQIDPQQPILVVSDAIHCVIRRCGDCAQNHRVRRLSNPTPIHNIVRMVQRFEMYECDHYDEETNRI